MTACCRSSSETLRVDTWRMVSTWDAPPDGHTVRLDEQRSHHRETHGGDRDEVRDHGHPALRQLLQLQLDGGGHDQCRAHTLVPIVHHLVRIQVHSHHGTGHFPDADPDLRVVAYQGQKITIPALKRGSDLTGRIQQNPGGVLDVDDEPGQHLLRLSLPRREVEPQQKDDEERTELVRPVVPQHGLPVHGPTDPVNCRDPGARTSGASDPPGSRHPPLSLRPLLPPAGCSLRGDTVPRSCPAPRAPVDRK